MQLSLGWTPPINFLFSLFKFTSNFMWYYTHTRARAHTHTHTWWESLFFQSSLHLITIVLRCILLVVLSCRRVYSIFAMGAIISGNICNWTQQLSGQDKPGTMNAHFRRALGAPACSQNLNCLIGGNRHFAGMWNLGWIHKLLCTLSMIYIIDNGPEGPTACIW